MIGLHRGKKKEEEDGGKKIPLQINFKTNKHTNKKKKQKGKKTCSRFWSICTVFFALQVLESNCISASHIVCGLQFVPANWKILCGLLC